MMTCGVCGQDVATCACADQDARLRQASDGDAVIFKWCRKCDKHYARCRCQEPDFGIRTGGQVYGPEYLDSAQTLDGRRVRIDPKVR